MPPRIADKLRRAIKGSGKTKYQLAKETGIPQSTIGRFMAGKNMGVDQAGILAEHLGMDLTMRHRRR